MVYPATLGQKGTASGSLSFANDSDDGQRRYTQYCICLPGYSSPNSEGDPIENKKILCSKSDAEQKELHVEDTLLKEKNDNRALREDAVVRKARLVVEGDSVK